MSDVKALFFDFGGVLLQHMDGIDHKAIESRLGLPEKTLYNCLYRDSRYLELHVGGCTHDEWVDSVRAAAFKHAGDQAEALMHAWQNAEHPLNPEMMSLVRGLRARGYILGIISNTIPGLEERLRESLPEFIEIFDIRVGSGDLGIAKPTRHLPPCLDAAGVAPEHSVFTDDMRVRRCCPALGMHGFHFTGTRSSSRTSSPSASTGDRGRFLRLRRRPRSWDRAYVAAFSRARPAGGRCP
jgi:FMN phosphatase YigB (HAD superfamily)